jgi:hypothetical protein
MVVVVWPVLDVHLPAQIAGEGATLERVRRGFRSRF